MLLSELLVNVRKELTAAEDAKTNVGIKPKYRVSEINVEVLVEDIVGGEGGVDFQIANLGARSERHNLHKIAVTLIPMKKS